GVVEAATVGRGAGSEDGGELWCSRRIAGWTAAHSPVVAGGPRRLARAVGEDARLERTEESAMKSSVRKLFYRSPIFQWLVGVGSALAGRTRPVGMAHLMSYRENDAIGPLQRDEAIALFGIVRTLQPKVVVEFGFFHGHSAFNFLQAMTPDAELFSYDIDAESQRRAQDELGFDARLHFFAKSQTDFAADDIGGKPIDFVFFDAAHELDLNQLTFQKILPHLAADAMIAVHDTGLWHRAHFGELHREFVEEMPGKWESADCYAHQPGEREFIDWIRTIEPAFGALHFHSTATLRHGFSLLQRQRWLADRGSEPGETRDSAIDP
ncbi:MAG: class I SAM-dependent methyltransferase, partial [Hyphomicrobiales bacterium]